MRVCVGRKVGEGVLGWLECRRVKPRSTVFDKLLD